MLAKTTSIRFTSRASVKIGDSFYTVEACEERAIPDIPEINMEEDALIIFWDSYLLGDFVFWIRL